MGSPASGSQPPEVPPQSAGAGTVPEQGQAPSAAAAKLDQIKDLYLTAEAIGEDALSQHFHQVSERQRQLIREYFDRAVRNRGDHEPPAT